MSSQKKHPLITGTVILTLTGLITRVMGFFYRIFLSHTIGAEGVGIYQLIFPVYALCFSFAVAGIQTGISRCCASALAQKNPAKARSYFSCGFFLSFSLSVIAAALLHRYAGFLSRSLLKEPRCTPLLQLVAWSVPLGTVHTCVSAWFFARKQTAVPSVSQFLEQAARIFSSVFFYLILSEKGIAPTPLLAASGLLAGELVASLFSAICLLFHFQGTEYKTPSPLPVPSYAACAGRLVALSLPLTVNRILLNLLQSGEAILIPSRLRQYGCIYHASSHHRAGTGERKPEKNYFCHGKNDEILPFAGNFCRRNLFLFRQSVGHAGLWKSGRGNFYPDSFFSLSFPLPDRNTFQYSERTGSYFSMLLSKCRRPLHSDFLYSFCRSPCRHTGISVGTSGEPTCHHTSESVFPSSESFFLFLSAPMAFSPSGFPCVKLRYGAFCILSLRQSFFPSRSLESGNHHGSMRYFLPDLSVMFQTDSYFLLIFLLQCFIIRKRTLQRRDDYEFQFLKKASHSGRDQS